MGNLNKELQKLKHPYARKTLALAKKVKKVNNRQKLKLGSIAKTSILAQKLAWFSEHEILQNRTEPLTPQQFEHLIQEYLHRFDDELEQIQIKQSIGKNRKNQHASRESVIKITLEKEQNEFNGGGMELVNLCDPIKMKSLIDWNGSGINVQHIKLDLISKKFCEKLCSESIDKPKIVITPPDEDCKSMEE